MHLRTIAEFGFDKVTLFIKKSMKPLIMIRLINYTFGMYFKNGNWLMLITSIYINLNKNKKKTKKLKHFIKADLKDICVFCHRPCESVFQSEPANSVKMIFSVAES